MYFRGMAYPWRTRASVPMCCSNPTGAASNHTVSTVLNRFIWTVSGLGIQKPVTEFEIVRQTATTAVVDGHDGMGQVIAYRSMQMAIDKAKAYGMGMVAVRNSTHYGIAGYYATMAANAGCIGITGTNARPSIAPTFGVENMLGTNPLTIGLPTDEEFPFVLDCATSITQRGKIEYYARIGKDTPAGMVIGEDGSALYRFRIDFKRFD